jgi:hypothetical protein
MALQMVTAVLDALATTCPVMTCAYDVIDRCGNTLLRRLMEQVTGIITGSDTRPDRTLSRSLAAFGLQVCVHIT